MSRALKGIFLGMTNTKEVLTFVLKMKIYAMQTIKLLNPVIMKKVKKHQWRKHQKLREM